MAASRKVLLALAALAALYAAAASAAAAAAPAGAAAAGGAAGGGYPHARCTDDCTPLDDYVAAPDDVFQWHDTGYGNYSGGGWTGRLINLTSCAWLTPEEVGSGAVWTHQLVIIVPDVIKDPSVGALWITGGENGDPSPPHEVGEDVLLAASLAKGAGVVAAALFQVPNEPVYFADDPKKQRRIEDALIAYGWSKFINQVNAGQKPNPQWLARLPMTKAAVRAMDAVTAFAANSTLYADAVKRGVEAGHFAAEDAEAATGPAKYVVAGASKRGWTTWTTTAVDNRVIAMIPVVMDALHVTHFMHVMWQSYGGWSFALEDYYALNITTKFDTPGHAALEAIVDPVSYIDRFTMPKLVIDATGDEFFMPTDDAVWWNDMPGPKKRLMVQNAEHSLATGIFEVLDSVVAWTAGVVAGDKEPSMEWTISPDGSNITMVTDTTPSKVYMWVGETPNKTQRDFRLITGQKPCKGISIKGDCLHLYFWKKTELSAVPGNANQFVATVPIPAKGDGWTGFLIEATWDSQTGISTSYTFTTQASIVPNDYLPFPDCHGNSCYGTLV